MFRWGILSTAKIGREHVIPGIVQSDNGILYGIASRDLTKAQALATQFGAKIAYGSYEAMLADPDIDGIYIPLPTSQHVEWTIKCADAGKHVLCEKPISLKAEEIQSLVEARTRNKVVISEAFMVTYHPQWMKVRDLIANGAIGTLRHVQGAFTYFNTDPGNMRNILELGGGALPDIGVYPTVTTRFATGKEPQKVSASVKFDPVFKTDVFSTVRADFGDFELSFYLSTQMANRQLMVFHGDAGFIEVHCPFNASLYDHDHITLHNRAHDGAQVFRFPGVHQYKLEAEAFVRAAKGEKQHVFSLEESISNQKLIDAVFKAGKSGNWEAV